MKFLTKTRLILGIIIIIFPIVCSGQFFQQLLPSRLTTQKNFNPFDNFHSELGLNEASQVECGDFYLPQLQFGRLSSLGGNSVGSRRSIICNAGFDIIAEHKRYAICTTAGRWEIDSDCAPVNENDNNNLSPPTTKAPEEKKCKSVFIPNGVLLPGDSSIGSRRTVQCHPGYVPEPPGNPFAFCRANQLWDVLTKCVLEQTQTTPTNPSQAPTTNSTVQNGHNLSDGAIAGIVIGVVLAAALAVTIGLLCNPYCDDLNGNL